LGFGVSGGAARPAGGAPGRGFEARQPPKGRAVIFEPHPAVRVALEYLLLREGYSVDARGEGPFAVAGQALMLVGVEDGLHIFVSQDAAGTIEGLNRGISSPLETLSEVTGIRAFVPKPFGGGDVLCVVRTVRGFDGHRRHTRERRSVDMTSKEDG
jgi:hypothetical protein